MSALEEPEQLRRKRPATKRAVTKKIKELTELKLSLRSSSEAKIKAQESGTPEREKGQGGADFVERHRQNFNYVKIHTLEFRGSAAFFLRQILTDYILSIATVITLDISTSQISSIDSGTAGFIITKGTLKTYCYIIFFILEGHFCPPCPSQQKARGVAAPPAPPPVPASLTRIQRCRKQVLYRPRALSWDNRRQLRS